MWKTGATFFVNFSHKAALDDYCHFMKGSNHVDLLIEKSNRELAIQHEQEKEFNKNAVTILLDVTQTLTRQGLALRGDGNYLNGNFCQVVQLISRYNSTMNQWIKNIINRPYHVTYMSDKSQNEFITILGSEVTKKK